MGQPHLTGLRHLPGVPHPRVNRQPSNDLKFKRQPSKKKLYFIVKRHKCTLISKSLQVSQISLFQLIFTDVRLLKNL